MNLIYLYRNKINNKCYVGRTCHIENPNIRWQSGKGYKSQPFYDDIVKYGWENFEHIILENNIPDSEVDKRENYWITYYNSDDSRFGYNMQSSHSVNPETRKRMSEAYHKKSPEAKEKARQRLINYSKTADRTGKNNGMYGSHRTGAQAARKRRVQCIETDQIFDTLTDASYWCNPNGSNLKGHIAQQIQGKRHYCGRHPETNIPLHWRYVDA